MFLGASKFLYHKGLTAMSILFEKFLRPILFRRDAEAAHEYAMRLLEHGLASETARKIASRRFGAAWPSPIERFGLKFGGPIGIAAGFDKNALVTQQLAALGFGSVEVGTVTLRPQPGNPKPRLFRLPDDQALINRLGFNNDGAEAVAKRLATTKRTCVVGVNIGRNKDVPNEEAVENYLRTFEIIHPVADYVTVNVSSPNTPGLRDLQAAASLDQLLSALQKRNDELGRKPLLVKIAPDLSEGDIRELTDVCIENSVDGMLATNTTISRDGLRTANAETLGAGGLSGRPLARRSTEVIRTIYRHTDGKMPIIGVGGIFTPDDAFEKIAAGACLLQAYTGFIYTGPTFARDLTDGLLRLLDSKRFDSLDAAIASAV